MKLITINYIIIYFEFILFNFIFFLQWCVLIWLVDKMAHENLPHMIFIRLESEMAGGVDEYGHGTFKHFRGQNIL